MRLHTGEKPYHCTQEGCKQSFATQGHLNDHVAKYHNPKSPYFALPCDKEGQTKLEEKMKNTIDMGMSMSMKSDIKVNETLPSISQINKNLSQNANNRLQSVMNLHNDARKRDE